MFTMTLVSDFAILAQKLSKIAMQKKVNVLVSNAPGCAILLCIVLGDLAEGGSVAVAVGVSDM